MHFYKLDAITVTQPKVSKQYRKCDIIQVINQEETDFCK